MVPILLNPMRSTRPVAPEGLTPLAPGMCAGVAAGTGQGHQLVNPTDARVPCLAVGDRTPGDGVSFPDDALMVACMASCDGGQ